MVGVGVEMVGTGLLAEPWHVTPSRMGLMGPMGPIGPMGNGEP